MFSGTIVSVYSYMSHEVWYSSKCSKTFCKCDDIFFIADATVMHVVHRFGNGWNLQSVLGGVGEG